MAGSYLYYFSPMTRLELYGVRLFHHVATKAPATFLFGWESVLESRTEQGGRMDTPLINATMNEVSSLLVERERGASAQDILHVQPKEWIKSIKNALDFKNETVPLNHPSIAEGRVRVDKQGTLIERAGDGPGIHEVPFWRMSRALQFLFPAFPKGSLRKEATWTDHVEWTDTISEWRIGWKADLRWVVKDFEIVYEKPCARLVYEATLTPRILQEPVWVGGAGKTIQYNVQGSGEVLYSIKEKSLISNTFDYTGTLMIPIPDLELVPDTQRVGDVLIMGKGDVVLKFKNKLDVRLP